MIIIGTLNQAKRLSESVTKGASEFSCKFVVRHMNHMWALRGYKSMRETTLFKSLLQSDFSED
jgi:hypothetical protein